MDMRLNKMTLFCLTAVLAVALGLPAAGHAQTKNISFGTGAMSGTY